MTCVPYASHTDIEGMSSSMSDFVKRAWLHGTENFIMYLRTIVVALYEILFEHFNAQIQALLKVVLISTTQHCVIVPCQ